MHVPCKKPDDVGKPAQKVTFDKIVMIIMSYENRKTREEMSVQWIKVSDTYELDSHTYLHVIKMGK